MAMSGKDQLTGRDLQEEVERLRSINIELLTALRRAYEAMKRHKPLRSEADAVLHAVVTAIADATEELH